MNEQAAGAATIKLVGGRLSLDFVNTADWRNIDGHLEYINSYGELISWGGHAGALSDFEVNLLGQEAERHPGEAKGVYESAMKLRGALLEIFHHRCRGESPAEGNLKIFNHAISKAMSHLTLSMEKGRFCWDWSGKVPALDKVLWPVVKDAADLLTSEISGRIRSCAGERCGWLFLDTSRNRSRRWCDMKECGNRAKVKRHYHKSKQ